MSGNETEEVVGADNRVAFSIEGIALLHVGILGIVGNVAAITVFARQHLQRNFHALMMSLSAFDLLYILASILLFSIPQFNVNYRQSAFYNYILPWTLPLAQVSITGSIYFTMAITVERYVCVCWPFYRVSHTLPAKMMVIPLVAFSFLYNTPKFFELHTIVPGEKMLHDNGTEYNATDYTFRAAPFRHNVYYFNIYCMWMNFFCMGLIPFVVLIVLNALTLKELTVISGSRSNDVESVNLKRNLVLAQVSLGIVFSFIVCHSIKWIPNIYEMLQVGRDKGQQLHWPPWIELVTHISHLMTVFNSSVNFYIYFAKHWRIILGRPEPSATNHTEHMRLQSVVFHDNNRYPSIAVNSFPQINTTNNTQLSANQHNNSNENTHMLVNAQVSASNDTNGTKKVTTKNGEVTFDLPEVSPPRTSELLTRNGEVHC